MSKLSPHQVLENEISFSPQHPQTLPTFECFPNLPLEVRNMIWTFAANTSRNIDIWMKPMGQFMQYNARPGIAAPFYHVYGWHTTIPPPAVLLICKESRDIALKHYSLDLGTVFEDTSSPRFKFSFTTPPRIWRNIHDRIVHMVIDPNTSVVATPMAIPCSTFAVNLAYDLSVRGVLACAEGCDGHVGGTTFESLVGKELLLFYCFNPSPTGSCDFVEISVHAIDGIPSSCRGQYITIFQIRNVVLEMFQEAWGKCCLEDRFRGKGFVDVLPVIKVVALVIDGVVRW